MFSRLASDESTKHVTTYSLHPGDPFHNFAMSKSYLGQYLLLNYRYLLLNYRYLLLSYWKAVEMTNMAYHVWTLGAEFEPKECLLTVNNDYGSPSSVGRSLMAKVVLSGQSHWRWVVVERQRAFCWSPFEDCTILSWAKNQPFMPFTQKKISSTNCLRNCDPPWII